MADSKKISVLVPAYNVEPWLPRCLDSVLAQSYKNLEVIVIDDGSTDNTGRILDEYAAKDSRIIAIHQKNQGLVAVRELGIRMATGEYVGFVDGDDAVIPDMYQRLLDNAIKYDADISHCGMAFLFPDGHSEMHYGTGSTRIQSNFEGQRDLLSGTEIEPSLCCKLYRRSLLTSSCLDQNVLNNEDLLRNFTLFQRAQKSVYEDFCGYVYYQYPSSMSKDPSKRLNMINHVLRARTLILEHCDENIYPYAMQLVLSTYVNTINQTSSTEPPEIQELCREFRQKLRENRKNIHYLIPRQRLAAYLIMYCPALQRLLYKIYSRRR